MQTLEPILADHPFFRDLSPEHLALVAGCASNVRFEAGEFLFHEGEEADEFYLIRHGRVALEIHTPDRGPIVLQTLTEGDVLGWSWLVPPYGWRFDARAVDLVRAIALDGKCLRAKCDRDHDLGYDLMQRIATIMEQRLQATRLQLLEMQDVRS